MTILHDNLYTKRAVSCLGGRNSYLSRTVWGPLGTDHVKPFIEEAPALIVVFKQVHDTKDEAEKKPNYYVNESVGIAVGMLLTALHRIGLVASTHTPSPMGFLSEALGRPDNERAYLNIPVGWPADGAKVPDLTRKSREEVLVEYHGKPLSL